MVVPLLVVAHLAAVVFSLFPCIWALRLRVSSFFCLSFWLFLLNLTCTIDTIGWSNSSQGPSAWCLVSSKLKFAGLLASPTATLCIARFLARTFSRDMASQLRPADHKSDILNCFCCFLAPIITMGTHFLFSPVAYALSPATGCEPTFFLALPTYLLFLLWLESLTLACFFVTCYLSHRYYSIHKTGVMREFVEYSPLAKAWLTEALLWRWLLLVAACTLTNSASTIVLLSSLSSHSGGYQAWSSDLIASSASAHWKYENPKQSFVQWLYPIQGILLGLCAPETYKLVKAVFTAGGLKKAKPLNVFGGKVDSRSFKPDLFAEENTSLRETHPLTRSRSRSSSNESIESQLAAPELARSSLDGRLLSRASSSHFGGGYGSQPFSRNTRSSHASKSHYTMADYTLYPSGLNTPSNDQEFLSSASGSFVGSGYFSRQSSSAHLTVPPSIKIVEGTPPPRFAISEATYKKAPSVARSNATTQLSSLRPGTYYETESGMSTRPPTHVSSRAGLSSLATPADDVLEDLSIAHYQSTATTANGPKRSSMASSKARMAASSKSVSTAPSRSRSLFSRKRFAGPRVLPWKKTPPIDASSVHTAGSEGNRRARASAIGRNFGPLAATAW